MQENFAKQIEQAMDTNVKKPDPERERSMVDRWNSGTGIKGTDETLLPDSARAQIEQATRALRVLGEDAKLLAGVLEHIQQATGKMQENLNLARKAIDAASKRL